MASGERPPRLGLDPRSGDSNALRQRRRQAAAQRKRRRGQIRLGGLAALAVIVLLVAVDLAGGKTKPSATDTVDKSSPQGTATDPLTTTAVNRWIASRQGKVSAAVVNLKTGQEWILNPSERDQTASIVKADILETVLYQTQQANEPVADAETDTAEDMIEESDNDDATDLWDQIGGPTGINAYNAKAGLSQTTPGADGYWGETLTSAADQIKILKALALPGGPLTSASKAYQLSLMEEIAPGENWGVTGGVPVKGVTAALKNGWVPLSSDTDWQVNSIGWIKGQGHDYLLAVLTAHDPSYQYGINTIARIAASVYGTLGPAAAPGAVTYNQDSDDDGD